MTSGKRIALGLLLAFFAQFLGMMLAGAGHGWVAPLFISIILWVLWPMTLSVAWSIAGGRRVALLAMLVVAVASDAWLVKSSIGEAEYISRYIQINGALGLLIVGLWLCLWISWQAILLYSLATGRQPADAAIV